MIKLKTLDSINLRRSIRKFEDKPVPGDLIEKLLALTVKAPSGKNIQPWRFVVIEGPKKQDLVNLLRKGAKTLQQQGINVGSCEWTAESMEQAPVIIMIYNGEGQPGDDRNGINRYQWSVNIQSIGGAIQTLLLAATALGLGTLWICDVFFAEEQISELLGRGDEMVAAVAVGYPAQSPAARPRKDWREVTSWFK